MSIRPILQLLLVGAVSLDTGCMAVKLARTIPGDDPRLIQGGADRAVVERALGPPWRTWQPNERVHYQLHPFRSELKGSHGDAAGFAIVDVLTLGVLEVADAVDTSKNRMSDRKRDQRYVMLWLGFDAGGHLFGVYPEFSVLPEEPPPSGAVVPKESR